MKRILSLVSALLIFTASFVLPVSADAPLLIAPNPMAEENTPQEVYHKSFRTSGDTSNYFEFLFDGNELLFAGITANEKTKYVCGIIEGEYILVPVRQGGVFFVTIDLSALDVTEFEFSIYTGEERDAEFYSAFYGRDIIIKKVDGEWGVALNKDVYDNNEEFLAGWIDEKAAIQKDIPDRIRRAAENVVAGLETDYEKARAIHKYVATTIYYDMDYAQGITDATPKSAEDVYDKGYAVCEGYANLTVALLNALDIPAVLVKGFSNVMDEYVYDWDEVKNKPSNHEWVEAYVDGRWIIMDPTWDSPNTIINSKKQEGTVHFYRYFDVSHDIFSAAHRIDSRPIVFGGKGPSSWALEEAKASYYQGLVTSNIKDTMTDYITREEFCTLLVNMISKKCAKSIEEILREKNLVIDKEAFEDTDSFDVLVCAALGIVNGKSPKVFAPQEIIKRQEAAVMLKRAAVNVFGVEKANSASIDFADKDTFADWGRDAIDFVSASVDKNGRKVMGGKGNNLFAPQDIYTKQESLLTIYRLYNAY